MNNGKWTQKPLIQIAPLQRGFDLPVQDRVPGQVPVFAANGPVGTHSVAKVTGPGVVTGRSGTIGQVHYVENDYWPLNTSLFVTDFCGNHPKFIYYLLKTLRLERYCEGTGVPTLNRNNIHGIQLHIPPPSEQRRIAAILDKADAIRRKREEGIRLTEDLLRSTFLQMFGDPGTNHRNWPTASLCTVAKLDRGRSRHRPRNESSLYGGPYPFIQTGDVANSDGYISSFTQTYSDTGLAQSKLWPAGTLCITIAANIAKTAILSIEACFPDSLVGLVVGNRLTIEYVRFWFVAMEKVIDAAATQVAQKNINLEILNKLTIPVPPLSLQQKFTEIVKQVYAVKRSRADALKECKTLSGSLIQRAFRGEL